MEEKIIRLNLACSDLPLKNWLNVDIRKEVNPDIVMDVRKLSDKFGKEVDEIYAGHFLEHLTPFEAEDFIEECKKVLVNGGKLGIVTPDTDEIFRMYAKGEITIKDLNDVYIFSYIQKLDTEPLHKSLWNLESLTGLFKRHKFKNIKEIDRMLDPRVAYGIKWQCGVDGET